MSSKRKPSRKTSDKPKKASASKTDKKASMASKILEEVENTAAAAAAEQPPSESSPKARKTNKKPKKNGKKASATADTTEEEKHLPHALTFKLMEEFDPKKSQCVSPISFFLALRMLADGADGVTRSELLALVDKEPGIAELLKSFNTTKLQLCNFLFTNQKLTGSFTDVLTEQYDASIGSNPTKARVNAVVSKATKGLIPELLTQDLSSDATVLLNTAYFADAWKHKFKPCEAKTGNFPKGVTAVESPKKHYGYISDETVESVKLPFGDNERISMMIVKPADFAKFRMSREEFMRIRNEMPSKEGIVVMPEFELDSKWDLKKFMKKHGVNAAFKPTANFSPMFDDSADQHVSDVIQRCVIKVDRNGAMAAAATAVTMCKGMSRSFKMMCDSSFYLFIFDKNTNMILFAGQYVF